MQSPLAAGINQPVAHQCLQDVLPPGPSARVRQARRPEPIEFELLVKMTRQPARPPLSRTMQLHRIEPYLQPVGPGVLRNALLGGKQRKLATLLAPFVESFDHSAPGLALAVVDLSEIKH